MQDVPNTDIHGSIENILLYSVEVVDRLRVNIPEPMPPFTQNGECACFIEGQNIIEERDSHLFHCRSIMLQPDILVLDCK
jgi:hypothetical protein